MRKIICLILVLLFPLLISGCWGAFELDDIDIVAGCAVDMRDNGEFEITTQIVLPPNVNLKEPNSFTIRQSTGKSFSEAIRKTANIGGKRQIWQHMKIILLDEKTAESGVLPILDYLIRHHEPRMRVNILVADDSGSDVLHHKSDITAIPVYKIATLLNVNKFKAQAPAMDLKEFSKQLLNPYHDPILPIISTEGDYFKIVGTAIFQQDRMVGKLSAEETMSVLYVLDNFNEDIRVMEYHPVSDQVDPVNISLHLRTNKTTFKADFSGQKPKIQIQINQSGNIIEINGHLEDGLSQNNITQIENQYQTSLEQQISETIERIQRQFKADIFNFSETIRKENKAYWNKHRDSWQELYPTLEIETQVRLNILNNGNIEQLPKV